MSLLVATSRERLLLDVLITFLAALTVQIVIVTVHQVVQNRQDASVVRVRAAYVDRVVALLAGDAAPEARRAFLATWPRASDERAIIAQLVLAMAGSVRGSARDGALALLREAGIPEQYQRDLGKRHPWRRATAVAMLGEMEVVEALPDLLPLLRDSSADVRRVTARALGRLGLPQAAEPLLAACEDDLLPPGLAAFSILHIGVAAVPAVRQWAAAAHTTDARAMVAELLGHFHDGTAVPELVGLLHDTSPTVRAAAAESLGRLACEDACAPLLVALSEDDARVRASAAAALGAIGDGQAIAPLLQALADPDDDVGIAAAAALVEHSTQGLAALLGMLGTAGSAAQARAIEAIERSGVASRAAGQWRSSTDTAERARAGHILRSLAAAGGQAPLVNGGISFEELVADVAGSDSPTMTVPRQPRPAHVRADVVTPIRRQRGRRGAHHAVWALPELTALDAAGTTREEVESKP